MVSRACIFYSLSGSHHHSFFHSLLRAYRTKAAAEFQQKWIERAKKLNEQEMGWFDESEGKSVRVDGAQMEKMDFDAVYSNKHVHKDTESGLGPGFIPVIDPRRDSITRQRTSGTASRTSYRRSWASGSRCRAGVSSALAVGVGARSTFERSICESGGVIDSACDALTVRTVASSERVWWRFVVDDFWWM